MAKQAVGPIVRHLEKAVLAVCGGAFLYAVAMYGVLSPNAVGQGPGETYGPAEVDRQVKEDAEILRDRLLSAEPDVQAVPNTLDEIRRAEDPLQLADVSPTTRPPVPFSLPVPDVIAARESETTRRLVEVLPLEKPVVETGRSGLYITPPSPFESPESTPSREEVFLRDVNWITVAAVFPRAEQEGLCRRAGYDPRRIETIFLGADLERRTQLADGTYADWEAVTPFASRARPVYPAPKVYKAENVFNVSEEDRAEVEAFIERISANESQLELMRPLLPAMEYPTPPNWLYPRIDDHDVLEMDREYQDPPGHCRYPECAGESVAAIDPKASTKDLLKLAEEALQAGAFAHATTLTDEALKRAERDRDKADADALLEKIRKAQEEQANAPRRRSPTQILWAHDIGDRVESGRTYQYRIRARLYNRYCGTPTLLTEPMDAEKVDLVGPWSDPSDSVTVPRDTLVFMKSSREQKAECKVEIFKWVAGAWVMRAFDVTAGERIGKEVKIDTPRGEKDSVNFDTGARVVAIDFARPYRGRDRHGRLERPTETTALVYVDATGQLHERLLDFDKNSSVEYQQMKRAVYKAPRTRESREIPSGPTQPLPDGGRP